MLVPGSLHYTSLGILARRDGSRRQTKEDSYWDICFVYLDDIIVTGMTFEEMLSNLRKVLDRLKGAGLNLKAKRCCLVAKKVTYLGHVVSAEGIATDPAKTAAV